MPADSYSARLRLRFQATGGNTNTWGALLNSAAMQLIEDSICGMAAITVTGDTTLTQNNGATDQSRMAILQLNGSPTAAFNIIAPQVSKLYFVINNTGQAATIKTSSGIGPVVNPSSTLMVFCDGSVNFGYVRALPVGDASNSLALGGIPAADYARLDIFNAFLAGNSTAFFDLTDGATITLNAMLSNCFYCLLAGNRTLVINNASDGQRVEIWFQQDGTGSRTMTWPATVIFESNSTGTLSVTPNAIDRFELTYRVAINRFVARSAIGSASTATNSIVISSNERDVNVFTRAGSPGGVVTINVTTAAGTVVSASSTANSAIDFSGFASGSTINWTNLGYVQGKGGDGGKGGQIGAGGSTITTWDNGEKGRDGGPAVKGPGALRNFNVTNGSGFIWGGGGGGGGGGAQKGSGNTEANGGGGGGGAGGGRGGPEGSCGSGGTGASNGDPGGPGGNGVNGTFGAAGTGRANGGGNGAVGGAGGDWGSPGASGTSLGAGNFFSVPGTAGAAGKAIDANGGSVTFASGSGGPNIKGAVA